MRRSPLILAVLLLCGHAFTQAPSFVQSNQNTTFSSPGSLTLSSNVTSGDLLIGFVYWLSGTATISSVTGTSSICSGTYTLNGSAKVDQNGSNSAQTFTTVANGTGSCTITVTFSASITNELIAHEVSGQASSSPIDQTTCGNQAFGTYSGTDALTSGSVTTTAANEYIFGAAGNSGSGTFTAGTGYTLRAAGSDEASESKTLASAGSVAATFQNGNAGFPIACVVTVKAAGGAVTIQKRKHSGWQ